MSKALSLKYRPSKFSDLIGQDSISQTLSLALDLNKVSHAYLFSGLRGSGKTSSARIFARALQCEKFPTSVPCGECDSCKSSLNNTHMDIIEMDAASSRSIDDIKDLIEQIQYKPAYSRFKIFIIDEVHMLTKEAFNALLKTLEEPPEYVKFILATTDPLKLPPTILSRTQHFRFKKIPQNSIATHLKRILGLEGVKFEDDAIDLLSRNCGGSLRDALTLLEQSIIFSKENITLESVSNMLGALNPSMIDDFFNAILSKNDSKIESILKEFESYEVENIVDEMIIFLKSRMLIKDSRYNLIIIDRFFRILGDAKNMLSQNAESSFVLLLTTLKFKEALNIDDINKIIAKIEKEVINDNFDNQVINDNKNISVDSNIKTQNTKPTIEIKPKFEQLIDKIYNRDYELGELFKKNIEFIDFRDSTLTWNSKAQGEDRDKLRQFFSVIMELVYEVFGENTKIVTPKKQNTNDKANKEPEIIKDIESIFYITEKQVLDANKE